MAMERYTLIRAAARAALGMMLTAVILVAPAKATEVTRVISPGGIEAWLV
jgi:hypothetical protein